MERQNDIILITRIRGGDGKALECLFRKYYTPLCRFAFFLTKRHDLSEEIVADVFFHLWKKGDQLNISLNTRSYLFTATRHTSLNYLKQERQDMLELSEDISVPDEDPSTKLIFKEFEDQMYKSISLLPGKRKQIFQLSRFDGLTYKEIAVILSISVKTVENQMGKAIKQLRNTNLTQFT